MTGHTVPPGLSLADHIERLDVLGYTVLDNVLDLDIASRAKDEIEHLYESAPGAAVTRTSPFDTYQVDNLQDKGRVFETFFRHPAALKLAERFLGPDYLVEDVWSFGIAPGAPADRLHCDEDKRSPGHPSSMIMIYPLVDFTPSNGGTRVVPGSHWIPRDPDREYCQGELSIEAPVGSCVILFSALWHASNANSTDATRTSMTAIFSIP
jgi:ectoine hydroxylase-related dioxygenase (phytanoyl-CoA dioxygenase family)